MHSFVTSRIDYCNSLLANLSNCVLTKLQKVQNVAARILTRRRDVHDISPVLIDIHWLPILLRICYTINLLTFKCLHELGPPYLKNLFSPYISLNETSDQLLKDFLKKLVINLRIMDVVPILLLVQVFGIISLLILDLKMI